MKLLAFDASTEFLSIALQINQQLESVDIQAGQTASQLILPQIQLLLDKARLNLSDLDGIAFGAGPGSFTGVRIACGVAQGLAFGANLPVVGINGLMALAERVIAASDARMGEVYHAAYIRKDGDWTEMCAAGVYKPQDVPAVEGDDWVGVGTAWKVYDETLLEQYQQQVSKTLSEMTPKAEAIMRLAIPIFARGEAVSASKAAPIYIRNRVALTSKEREQGLRL